MNLKVLHNINCCKTTVWDKKIFCCDNFWDNLTEQAKVENCWRINQVLMETT